MPTLGCVAIAIGVIGDMSPDGKGGHATALHVCGYVAVNRRSLATLSPSWGSAFPGGVIALD